MRGCVREAGSQRLRRRVARIAAPVSRAKDAAQARAMCHLACGMLEECRPRVAEILEGAEPDALAYPDLPRSRWKRPRTNNAQERANRETKRRSRVVQALPPEASLERLMGAAMRGRDEERSEPCYFSERWMAGPYEDRSEPPALTSEQQEKLQLIAERAIKAGLELADRMEAA